MTRDEAVRRIIDCRYGPAAYANVECQATAHAAIREYVALGLIKLDEPRSALSQATDIIAATSNEGVMIGVSESGTVMGDELARRVTARLAAAGFKLVKA